MKNVNILILGLSLCLSFQCKQKAVKPACENNPCGYKSEIKKTVYNQVGRVFYDKVDRRYIIVVTTGTTDAQDVGILCDLPVEFQRDGLHVIFDGKYRSLCKQHVINFAGQTYYYLEVSKIHSKRIL